MGPYLRRPFGCPVLWPAVLGLSAVLSAPLTAKAATAAAPAAAAAPHNTVFRSVTMESGSGQVLTLPSAASNVFVADPRVAEVRPASPNTLFVFGVGPGHTTIAAMDQDGHAVSQFEVTVHPSMYAAAEAEAVVARLLPGTRIHVTPQARGVLLTGNVSSPAEAARAVSILKGYLPKDDPIENQMAVQSSIQVNLRVRIVEMQRNVTRALGIDWQSMGTYGKFATVTGLGGLGTTAVGQLSGGTKDFNGIISALANDNLLRVLAEPNMTVLSGQPGSFLAGGEFPIPVATTPATGGGVPTISVTFKKYGISLDVVPTVLSDGRINLHVAPEVSQLSTTGAVTLSDGSGGTALSIPGLVTRRTETTVELGSGQSFALAGLLQDNVTQQTSGLPYLSDVPVLGSLFRSTSFQRNETELVILVTPYIVRPVDDPGVLKTGNDNFTIPSDFERIVRLRQVSADAGATNVPRIPGAAGFIVQ
jgi:pilus assembly protein CpaC